MGKSFIKFRVSRVIPTFQFCRSKDPSTLPTNPVPSYLHHSTTSSSSTNRSSIKRQVCSAVSSARRSCLRPTPSPEPSHTESFKWGKNQRWHVIAKIPQDYHNYDSASPRRKIYNSGASDTEHENDVVFLPPLTKQRTRKTRRRRRSFQKVRISTSSDSGIFSEDDDDQTLVSTGSPSTISSSHFNVSKSMERNKKFKNRRSSFEAPAPARLSAFMRKMAPCKAVVDGKVRESYAVVKRSEDPLDDFKRSMVEMVVEKQMFEEKELAELLRCFLSLNSERHHEAIVKAFTEIWEGLFCQSPQ